MVEKRERKKGEREWRNVIRHRSNRTKGKREKFIERIRDSGVETNRESD